jgi:hypothetical protein
MRHAQRSGRHVGRLVLLGSVVAVLSSADIAAGAGQELPAGGGPIPRLRRGANGQIEVVPRAAAAPTRPKAFSTRRITAPKLGAFPLCGVSGTTCTYAFSTERQLVSTAIKAIQVYRSVDGTTQDVGFIASGPNTGLVNTATVDAFCNASVGGVISRNCFLAKIYEQNGVTNCNIYNATASDMPNYMVTPAHGGLPDYQRPFNGGGIPTISFGIIDNNGGNMSGLAPLCNALTGGPQSLFFSGSSLYGNSNAGQSGLQENTSSGGPQGAMFSAFIGLTGESALGTCINASLCGGVDTEGQGPQAPFTRTGTDDVIDEITYDASTTGGIFNMWVNHVQIVTNNSQPDNLVTQHRMSWGAAGDHTVEGPALGGTETFYTSALTPTQVANLYSNETSFISTLSLGYQGPGDLFGETSYSTGLTPGRILQMQYLSQAFSLRKAYAAYEGPALNVCQGSGSHEDIGWVNKVIDITTMSAFCGPVSGLNNCAVKICYNQALNQSNLINGVGTSIDATAISTSRPTIVWTGCQTTAITICIATSPTNNFGPGGGITIDGASSMSAVAQRTGGTGATSAIISSTTTSPTTFLGFSTAANTCSGIAHVGGPGPRLTRADNAVHSITLDAKSTPNTVLYVDGTASTATTGTIGYSATGLGVGATVDAGLNPCTCKLSEVLVFADAHNTSFGSALGPAGVATLRANQRSAFGF